ncbi:Uncharacterized protein M6B38_219235 [Iris pallida]|uniref:Myb/SANT-like domain-containing protein n=1 Tax=Iris pallida TaxID=29817 RepID=A0AAX6DXR7_IRIPA|nr:Uncharacterized protein M6B38_219235 [Iris pallida]
MGDNFPNYRHFQSHAGSPFVPPQTKRRSLGTSTGSEGHETGGVQERVTQPSPIRPLVTSRVSQSMPDINWSGNIDPFMDSYSFVVSQGSIPLGLNEDQAESPQKNKPKKPSNSSCKNVQKEGGGTPNKRWEDEHTDELLKILAREAEEGKKCDKAFKNSSYILVANMVNAKFGTSYNVSNVTNHLRGWKSKWLDIMKAKDFSVAGWDEDQRMVTMDEDTHDDLKKAKSKLAQWVNVPIRNFDLLQIVCGDDHARGDRTKDNNVKWGPREYVEVDTPPGSGSHHNAATSQSTKSTGGKRHREASMENEGMSQLVGSVTSMAEALRTGFKTPIEKMGSKLFALEGYEPDVLMNAYNFLCTDNFEANKFIGLLESFQRAWLDNFMQDK